MIEINPDYPSSFLKDQRIILTNENYKIDSDKTIPYKNIYVAKFGRSSQVPGREADIKFDSKIKTMSKIQFQILFNDKETQKIRIVSVGTNETVFRVSDTRLPLNKGQIISFSDSEFFEIFDISTEEINIDKSNDKKSSVDSKYPYITLKGITEDEKCESTNVFFDFKCNESNTVWMLGAEKPLISKLVKNHKCKLRFEKETGWTIQGFEFIDPKFNKYITTVSIPSLEKIKKELPSEERDLMEGMIIRAEYFSFLVEKIN